MLKIAYFSEKNPSNFSKAKFHPKYLGLLWVNLVNKCGLMNLRFMFRLFDFQITLGICYYIYRQPSTVNISARYKKFTVPIS